MTPSVRRWLLARRWRAGAIVPRQAGEVHPPTYLAHVLERLLRLQRLAFLSAQQPSESRCRCGGGEPSPGADVAGVLLAAVSVQKWEAVWPKWDLVVTEEPHARRLIVLVVSD